MMAANDIPNNLFKRIDVNEFSNYLKTDSALVELVDTEEGSVKEFPIKRRPEMVNNHLEYAITWFGLTAATLLLVKTRNRKVNKMFRM
jgi:cytochrome oxidase assembly protein ShyY1